MAALPNARHERFAQGLAKGKSAGEAYADAGYAPNDGNCIRLKGDERIAARVAELLEFASTRVEISVARITEELLCIAESAKENATPAGWNVARAAYMDAAKLNGLVVDRSEVNDKRAESLADDELARIATGGGAGTARPTGRPN